MMQKIGMFLQLFYLLKSKFFWILVILITCLYFGYQKYGDQIIEKNPKLQGIKKDIEGVHEKAQGVKEKAQTTKDKVDSIKNPKSSF